MNADPEWTLARSFLEVARRGSLSAAARQIGVTQPTIARHVEEFERKLGVALFTRSPSGLALTPEAPDCVCMRKRWRIPWQLSARGG